MDLPDANFMASNISRFPKGGVIIVENDPASKGMCFVLQGNVGVYRNFRMHDEFQIKVLNQGDFWGEFPLFLNTDHRASLVALEDTVVLMITRRNLNEFFVNQPDIAMKVMESLCKRLHLADVEINRMKGGAERHDASKTSSLFPPGHGSYTLPLANKNEALFEEKITCPLCGQNFTNLSVISTRLRIDRVDPDMRTRYKEVEPLYYEIVTCPVCFFSAQGETFSTVSKKLADGVNQKIGPYKLDMYVKTGMERDTYTAFAGYYLAILCASVCFDYYQATVASLWQKLSRLYQDCGDNAMFQQASRESLENYIYAYEHFNISSRQVPQYCFVIGDLYQRLDDIDNARNYFYLAKTNREITPQLKRHADLRLDELKELKKARQ